MSFLVGRRAVTALLGAVLTVGLVAGPAQAGPRSPDPELVQPAAAPGPASAPSSQRAAASIDSDVYAYAASPTSRIYFVVAGRLKLQLKSGSTTTYKGSLIDYTGNKSYDASADATNPNAPKIKLKTKNGTFEFVSTSSFGSAFYSATGTRVPSKLKVEASSVTFGASTHTAASRSYSITLTERSGAINNPFEYVGTLTLVYDANGRISGGSVTVSNSKGKNVTRSLTNSGYSSSSYFYTVAKIDNTYFGITATVDGSFLTGYAFGANGSKTTQWLLSGTA
jgi:hypothetical protein